MKRISAQAVLSLAFLLLPLALVRVVDAGYGRLQPRPGMPGYRGLVFPPNITQTFEQREFTYTARINSLGLRDAEIAPLPEGHRRILFIGDSFTFGWGVELEQAYPKRLERMLNEAGVGVQCVVAARPGAGPYYYHHVAREAIPLLRPDLVVVGVYQLKDVFLSWREDQLRPPAWYRTAQALFPNALREIEYRRVRELLGAEDGGRASVDKGRERNRAEARALVEEAERGDPEAFERYLALPEDMKRDFLDGLLSPDRLELLLVHPDWLTFSLDAEDPRVRAGIRNMAAHLGEMRRIAGRHNAEMVVVGVPMAPYVNAHAIRRLSEAGFETDEGMLESESPDEIIRRACGMSGVPFFSVASAFRERREDDLLYYPLDLHFSPDGHDFFARQLLPIVMGFLEKFNGVAP